MPVRPDNRPRMVPYGQAVWSDNSPMDKRRSRNSAENGSRLRRFCLKGMSPFYHILFLSAISAIFASFNRVSPFTLE